MKSLQTFFVAAALIAAPGAQAQRSLLIPFNTSFAHSEHHWIAWMPTHPVYESVEVRSNADPAGPNGASVQVFFTERAGGKNQIHYFNTQAAAQAFRGPTAVFREMSYKLTGAKGAPQSLDVRFNDKDDCAVEISLAFAPGQAMTDVHAGLTNQMGHNRDVLFLLFFREKAASAAQNRIVLGGQDYSLTADRATSEEQLSRTGYRSNVFIITFPFGSSQYTRTDSSLANSWRRAFRVVGTASGERKFRADVADGTVLEVLATPSEEIREYAHLNRGHTMRVAFTPPLPSVVSATDGQRIQYEMSIDNFGVVVNGVAVVHKTGSSVVIDWQHSAPAWTKGYHFQSVINSSATGYDLQVKRAANATAAVSQTPAAKFVDSARVEIDKAVETSDQSRLENAVLLLDRALVAFPGDAYLLHYRGYAAYRQALYKLRAGEMPAVSAYVQRGIADLERSSDKLAWPETFALLSAMHAFRIAVDPDLARTVGPEIAPLRARAMQIGPENPRVLLLGVYALMKTSANYGGGMDAARALLVRAIAAFEKDKPAPLAPSWGRNELAALKTQLGVTK